MECMVDLNLIFENCQCCEDEESIMVKVVIFFYLVLSYVEIYVGRVVLIGQYCIDRLLGLFMSLYDKGGCLDIVNYCMVSFF